MRVLLLPLLFCFTFILSAQRDAGITLNISQDGRLLLLGDTHNNNAGTLNIVTSAELRGFKNNGAYLLVRPEYEIALLQGGTYNRYSVNAGVSFSEWLSNLTFIVTGGYGFINYNGAFFSFGNNLQLAYQVSKRFEVFLDLETVERKDLLRFMSTNKLLGTAWRTSGKFGIKFRIN